MNNFTYERESTDKKLETYEWDNIWWEHADDNTKPRVLIIGDSISCGYRTFVNEYLNGEIYADGLGTSKAVDNKDYLKLIEYMLCVQNNYSAIIINNGLHGWHLSDDSEFFEGFKNILEKIRKMCPDAVLGTALITPLLDPDNMQLPDKRMPRVAERNNSIKKASEICGAKVCDLYSVILNHTEVYWEDGVHLLDSGYKMLAKEYAEFIKKLIGFNI